MTTRVSRRAYWHRKIRDARQPLDRLQMATDYLRAIAKSAPDRTARRVIMPVTEAIQEAADDLEAALRKANEEGKS